MKIKFASYLAIAAMLPGLLAPVSAQAQTYERIIQHSSKPCQGSGPALAITIDGVKNSVGTVRVVLYRAQQSDWLEKGRWMQRFEIPAQKGRMQVCMPVPAPGEYAVAMRHDSNGNGKDEIFADGGGMSRDPSVNVFNLGRPHVSKASFTVGNEVKPMTIRMRYL